MQSKEQLIEAEAAEPIQPEQQPEKQSFNKWGCLRVFIIGFAICTAIALCFMSLGIAWGGSYFIAKLAGPNTVIACIGGAVFTFVAAILTLPIGVAPVAFIGEREHNEKGGTIPAIFVSAVAPILAALLHPYLLFGVWLIAPAAGAYIQHEYSIASAAMWCGIAGPLIGVANGFLIGADLFSSPGTSGD